MPKYKVQLKQGSRTLVNQVEAKSVADCLALFNELTTMKVSEILEVKYTDDTKPPIDDFNYFSIYKGMLSSSAQRMSYQVLLNNVKLTKNEDTIAQSLMAHLEINGFRIDSVMVDLLKQ
ncbi:hypothetical protein SUSP_001159 [Sulfurospirillum sp. 'SP']|nr:hypothetical protein [Sulfurospirillum sp. 'SP']WNY98741.1 hypothetical protein SUSP_001159 [Sulfurospirillum sp. 'SP']